LRNSYLFVLDPNTAPSRRDLSNGVLSPSTAVARRRRHGVSENGTVHIDLLTGGSIRYRRSLSSTVRQSAAAAAMRSTSRLQLVTLPPTPLFPVPATVRFVRLAAVDGRGSRRRSRPTGRRDGHVAEREVGSRRRLDESLEKHGAPRRAKFQLVGVVVMPNMSPFPRLHPKRSHVSVLVDPEVQPSTAAAATTAASLPRRPSTCRLGVLPAVVDVVQP